MQVKVKLNQKNINMIKKFANEALVETADAVKSDLVQSQTMPYDTGALQNRSTFVDSSDKNKGKVSVVSDTPYARRLYFHPEYNFQTDKNSNAGGLWFDPYLSTGKKKAFVQNTFNRIMREKMK